MSREELKKAMLLIKEECKRNYNCDSCTVKQLIRESCKEKQPDEWIFNNEDYTSKRRQ